MQAFGSEPLAGGESSHRGSRRRLRGPVPGAGTGRELPGSLPPRKPVWWLPSAQPAKELPKAAAMATEYLRVLVNTVAIRDEPGSTDRLGDFTKNDAVKLIKPCTSDGVPEWVEVDMVGAIREPAEEGRERPSKGFVRTRNRVATLLEPWTDSNEAAKARDDQAAKRNDGTSWFKSATRTAASAASHAKPLLAGGREEYERRQRLHAAASDIMRECQMGPVALRAKLLDTFDEKDWAAAHLADDKVLRALHFVAERDARAPAVESHGSVPTPPSPEQKVLIRPPPSPARGLVTIREERKASVGPGPTTCDLGPATEVEGALGTMIADADVFGELWVRLPFASRAALAETSRGVCKAARGVPWRRQCVALADACGVLDAAFGDGATDAVDDAAWRARFVDVWTRRRHKWRGGADPGGSFSIRAVVRFRPRLVAASETDHGGVFLPLHQRLQLRKLGHNTPCLEAEVSERIGLVNESVETYADRQKRRRSEARRNTEALRRAKKEGKRLNSENLHPNCAPAPAAAEAPAPMTAEAPAPACEAPAPAPAEEEAPRGAFAAAAAVSAKVVGVESQRVLVGVPGTGLSYFDFERVLDGGATQASSYETSCAPLVKSFCDGTNGCLLAYGQTGSGKTHTMFGLPDTLSDACHAPGSELSRHAGVVPRALADCLKAVEGAKERGACVHATLSFTYLELYREQLTDLMTGERVSLYRVGKGAAADEYREQAGCDDDVLLGNATHFDVTAHGAKKAWAALAEAEGRKRRAATAMNARSSRAHTVFALSLTQRRSINEAVLSSKLYLCDLGGSEQVKKSKATGQRFQEAVEINRSLTVLGRVVDALVRKNKYHVPYYESRLTTLLQPAFGGNARTTILIAASPDDKDGDEALAALRFGRRCARIENSTKCSTANMKEVLEHLEGQIDDAKKELATLEARGAKQRADAEASDATLRGMGAGHNAASRLTAVSHQDDTGGDITKESRLAGAGAYTHVDDDAGQYVILTQKLAALEARRRLVVG